MAVIKKRVSLDFIGEEYKDSYLVFSAIASKDFPPIQKKLKQMQTDKDDDGALSFITAQLVERFIEGEISDEALKAADIEDLPLDVLSECFQQTLGQISPKD